MSVAWVAVGVAALGTAVSVSQSNKAIGAQSNAVGSANDLSKYEFDQNMARSQPWVDTGGQALNALAQGMGLQGSQAGVTAPLSYDAWKAQNAPGAMGQPGAVPNGKGSTLTDPLGLIGKSSTITDPLGIFGSSHSGQKAAAQAAADKYAAQEAQLQQQYKAYTTAFKPTAVTGAGTGTNYFHDFGTADFQTDPGYQFRLGEGMKGVQASAAARGGLLSGGTLKAIDQYNQNFASNEYSNAYNRFSADRTNRFNRLSSIAGLGQTAVQSANAAGTNYANTVGSNTIGLGNAQAANAINTGNQINNGLSSLGNFYMQQQYFNKINPQPVAVQTGGSFAPNSGSYNI